jgi:MerR HTH family regulatory protein
MVAMWTLDELVERVREALAGEYPGAPNGRVRDVPDRRAIRWYTTIGLVDRPLGMRGRTALYGPRHLQQLVAIKRRQAEGQSLAQIQAEFTWLSPQALTDASRVPGHLLGAGGSPPDGPSAEGAIPGHSTFHGDRHDPGAPDPGGSHPGVPGSDRLDTSSPARHHFWTDQPSPRPPLHTRSLHAPSQDAPPSPPATLHGLALGGGAVLLLPRPAGDRDRADIAAAAAPLLDLLETRGLIDGRQP